MSKPVVVENDAILNSSGFITARRMATVSAEIMGLITEVNVEEGMQVEHGQVLATLDDALATVNLELAQAQVEVLDARKQSLFASLEEAKRNHKRVNDNDFSSDTTGPDCFERFIYTGLQRLGFIKAGHYYGYFQFVSLR